MNNHSDKYEQVEPVENADTDQWRQVYQTHYDRENDGELATELVFAIAEVMDVDPLDHTKMSPLYESVDAQALEETFFGPSGADTQRDEAGAVTFMYTGHKVALRSDGWIFIYKSH